MCLTKATVGGRVRDADAKKLVAKQLNEATADLPQFDLKTGAIKQKKAKKEKTPEQEAARELKLLDKKNLVCNRIPYYLNLTENT